MIYTRDISEQIIDLFDSILCQHNILVPSPDDTDEFKNRVVGFHGKTYIDLLDDVEANLINLLKKYETDKCVILNQFSYEIKDNN